MRTATTPARILIGIVGLSGTGKSEAVRCLENRFETESIYFGGLVVEEVRRRGLAVTEDAEAKVRRELRATHGMGAMALLSLPKIHLALQSKQIAVIDGIYSMMEYEILRKEFPELSLLALHASKTIRRIRLASRKERPLSPDEMDIRDLREIKELDKGGPIALADYHYVNDFDIERLRTFVDSVADELLKVAK